MPRCPECSTEYAEGLAACPSCGYSEASYRCERCGEEYGGGDSCPVCGKTRMDIPCEKHPDVLAEGRCVVCGRALCKECRQGDGLASLCADHGGVQVIGGWAQVYSTTREFEAQLLRDNLSADGIEARIFSQRDNMFSVDIGELSIVRLLVPAYEFERAIELLRAHMDLTGEVAFACPSCGEAYEPGARRCAACGELLVPPS